MRSLISQPDLSTSSRLIQSKKSALQLASRDSVLAIHVKYVLNECQITPKETYSAMACAFIAGYSVVPSSQLSNYNNQTESSW